MLNLRKNTYEILSFLCKTKPIFKGRIQKTGVRRQNTMKVYKTMPYKDIKTLSFRRYLIITLSILSRIDLKTNPIFEKW